MSVHFDGSTQYLTSTDIPVTSFPFTVGCWFYMDAVSTAAQNVFGLQDTGSANNMFIAGVNSAEAFRIAVQGGGSLNTNAGGTVSAGVWNYGIWRYINATNYRGICLHGAGNTSTSTVTTSTTPTGIDTMTLGARQTSGAADFFWGGRVAEFWIANGDIYRSTTLAVDGAIVRHIAFHGPLKTPCLNDMLVHYRSFRESVDSPTGNDFDRGISPVTWTNTGGATLHQHPPVFY